MNPHRVLDIVRGWRGIRVGLFEKASDEGLQPWGFEHSEVDFSELERISDALRFLLSRANLVGEMGAAAVDEIERLALLLFDEIMPPSVKPLLRRGEGYLTLRIDESLQHLPWELMHTGERFLTHQYALSREVMRQGILAPRPMRTPETPVRVLVVADPRGDLPISAREGMLMRELFATRPDVRLSYKGSPIPRSFLRENLREHDVLHFAGHAEWGDEGCGWLLDDGRFEPEDVERLVGGRPMPVLIFANACASGQAGRASGADEMASALISAGARNVIGTMWDIPDSIGILFADALYSHLLRGCSIGEAMRHARLELSEQFGHGTMLWGSYVLYGAATTRLFTAEPRALERDGEPMRRSRAVLSMRDLEAWLQPSSPISPNPTMRGTETPSGRISSYVSDFQKAVVQSLLACALLLLLVGFGVYVSVSAAESRRPGSEAGAQGVKKSVALPPPAPGAGRGYQGILVETSGPEDVRGFLDVGVMMQDDSGATREVRVEEGESLRSGDRVKVRFHTNSASYGHVFHINSEGRVSLIFPQVQPGPRLQAGTEVSLRHWLGDESGLEHFVLVLSARPLNQVDGLREGIVAVTQSDTGLSQLALREALSVAGVELFSFQHVGRP